MRCRPPRIAVGLAASFFGVAGASCDGPGNSGKVGPAAGLIEQVPWLNGVLPALDASGQAILPPTATFPPIALGLPDAGPQRINCAALDQYEFSKGWFDDFELKTADPQEVGVAPGWASYDDLSKYAWHTPGDATWYPGLNPGTAKLFSALWGLPAERLPGPSCDGKPNDWVLHFKGGLFRKWGGGMSHAFMDPVGQYRFDQFSDCNDPVNDDFCPPKLPGDPSTTPVDAAGLPTQTANGDVPLQSHDFFDVSKYDGIAFWARRGPEGSAQSLVILTDKFTSSRLARENQKYCRRVRECHSQCLSGSPCAPHLENTPTGQGDVYRCFDPAVGIPANVLIESQVDLMWPRCGPSACTSPISYQDRDFDDKPCTRYVYPSADESGEYCFDPKTDPPPAGRDERCQDGWQTAVQLSSDWKFYALPWSQFGQGGFGKKGAYLDLKSLDTMAFGATMGWADVYFDNITLYRRKK